MQRLEFPLLVHVWIGQKIWRLPGDLLFTIFEISCDRQAPPIMTPILDPWNWKMLPYMKKLTILIYLALKTILDNLEVAFHVCVSPSTSSIDDDNANKIDIDDKNQDEFKPQDTIKFDWLQRVLVKGMPNKFKLQDPIKFKCLIKVSNSRHRFSPRLRRIEATRSNKIGMPDRMCPTSDLDLVQDQFVRLYLESHVCLAICSEYNVSSHYDSM